LEREVLELFIIPKKRWEDCLYQSRKEVMFLTLTVAFEGLPGCGKTTVINELRKIFEEKGFDTGTVDIETTGHAPELRPIAKTYPPGHPSRIMIFWMLRLQQHEAMQKMIGEKDIVFADRFWGSTLAMDIYGNKVPSEAVEWIGAHIEYPDVTIFFDAPLGTVLKRKKATTMQNKQFARRVEKAYKKIAKEMKWKRIDATQKKEKAVEDCLKIILPKL